MWSDLETDTKWTGSLLTFVTGLLLTGVMLVYLMFAAGTHCYPGPCNYPIPGWVAVTLLVGGFVALVAGGVGTLEYGRRLHRDRRRDGDDGDAGTRAGRREADDAPAMSHEWEGSDGG